MLMLKRKWAVTSEILMCFSRHCQKSKQCVRNYTTSVTKFWPEIQSSKPVKGMQQHSEF